MSVSEQIRRSAAERAAWFANPPNGRRSSELEIVSPHAVRRQMVDRQRVVELRISLIERYRAFYKFERAKSKVRIQVERAAAAEFEQALASRSFDSGAMSVRKIACACCHHFNISLREFLSHRRLKRVVRIRHIAYYLCRQLTAKSLPQIGAQLAGRDHTTVLHGCDKIATLLPNDEQLQADIKAVRALLGVSEEQPGGSECHSQPATS